MSKYDDIINLPHHVSKTRKPMPLINRAAQFAPFAALSGHDEAIAEAARQTTPKDALSLNEQEQLSGRLSFVLEHISNHDKLVFTYFVPDKLKDGGEKVTITGVVRKFDEYERTITLYGGRILHIDNILSVSGDIFDDVYW